MSVTVSVIVPFLNQAPFLAEAIESVRAQTTPNWELLLVNDGSRDASVDIAASYAAADSDRIRVLQHPDGDRHGAATSRNLGVTMAAGEYISFLDADDLYTPDKLLTEVALLRAAPEAMMLYAPTIWWFPGTERPDRFERPGVATGSIHQPPSLLTNVLLLHKGSVPCTCAALIHRAAVIAVGGFEEDFCLYEDQTLWAKLFLRYPVFVSPRPTSRYRHHGDSTSAAALRAGTYHPWRMHAAEQRFLEWLRSHVDASGIYDPTLDRELDRALAPYRRRSAAARRWARDLSRWTKWRARAVIKRLLRRPQKDLTVSR